MSDQQEKKIRKARTLQLKIVERFMSPEELETFKKNYEEHSGMWGARSRFVSLTKPLKKMEKKCLRVYFFADENIKVRDLAKSLGISHNSLGHRSRVGAIKILYQNRDKIDLKEILGIEEGGEK